MIGITAQGSRLHWRVESALGAHQEWDAMLQPGEAIEWRSADGASVPNSLTVQLDVAPADQGTELRLVFRFDPPGGVVGDALATLLGFAPDVMTGKLLRRYKALVETGEIPTLQFNTSHRKDADQPGEQK